MHKMLAFILILCSLLCVSSCNDRNNRKEIVALENGFLLDGGSDVLHKTEYSPWSVENTSPHTDDTVVAKNKTIAFNGKEYNGTYENSSTEMFCDYQTDFYKCENGSRFAVNHNTGEVCAFEKSAYESGEMRVLTEEEVKQYSAYFASKYIDVSDYVLSVKKEENRTVCTYTKVIDGVTTAEFLCVCIDTQSGDIVKFNTRMLNRFGKGYMSGKETELNELLEAAPNLADQKLENVFADSKFTKKEFKKSKETLCILNNDQLSIVYSVDVKLSLTENHNSMRGIDFLYIIVKYN